MIQFEQFTPAAGHNSLTLDVHDAAFEEPVAYVDEHLSSLGIGHFVDKANVIDRVHGMQFKLVSGPERSQEEAILMPGTFANGIWPHVVARAEAVRIMVETAGVRSSAGEPLPVLMVAAPSLQSRFDLNKLERAQVANGDYAPIADRHVALMDRLGYSAFRGVFYSQAAAFAETIAQAGQANMDIGAMIVGEPPHVQEQSFASSIKGFVGEGSGFKAEIEDEGIRVIQEMFATKQAARSFELGVIAAGKENLAVVRGFGQGYLENDLVDLNMSTLGAVTLLHASDSKVTNAQATRELFERATGSLLTSNPLYRVEIAGTNHSLGDRVGRFATLSAAALR